MVGQLIRANVSLCGSELTLMISLFHLMALSSILPIRCNFLVSVSIKILILNFHVKETVRKVSRKLQVLKRYKHLIPTHAKKRLYLAYFLPHLTFCSTVWLHCGKRNADIIEKLNESILRFVFNDFNNSHETLLQEIISLL